MEMKEKMGKRKYLRKIIERKKHWWNEEMEKPGRKNTKGILNLKTKKNWHKNEQIVENEEERVEKEEERTSEREK